MQNTATPKQANRRRSMRRKMRTSVKVECRRGTSGLGRNLVVLVLDLADSGVRMTVSEAIEAGSEVEIILNGYGLKSPLRHLGAVRWQVKLEDGSFCIGVEFQKPISFRDWQNLASPN